MEKLTAKQMENLEGQAFEIAPKHTGWRSTVTFNKWEKYGKSRLYYNFNHYDRHGKRRNHDSGKGFINLETGEMEVAPSDARMIRKILESLDNQEPQEDGQSAEEKLAEDILEAKIEEAERFLEMQLEAGRKAGASEEKLAQAKEGYKILMSKLKKKDADWLIEHQSLGIRKIFTELA